VSLRRLSLVALALYAGLALAEPTTATVLVNHNLGKRQAAASGSYFHNFPQDTIPRDGAWLGLFCGKSGCEVREAVVTIMSGTVLNCNEGEGYAETIHVSGNPVAVFTGVDLRPGKVTTTLLATKEPPDSPHFNRLRKLGHWQVQLNGKPLTISWVRMLLPKAPDEVMVRYHVSDGATKQFVFSSRASKHADAGRGVTPFVHWAGDMDGDGKLDLLLEIPSDNGDDDACEVSYRLYLSSRAADGEVLHKAAQTSGHKPGCGC
jgi:hypothetical protein